MVVRKLFGSLRVEEECVGVSTHSFRSLGGRAIYYFLTNRIAARLGRERNKFIGLTRREEGE